MGFLKKLERECRLKVLSLFDGISVGYLALKNLGIEVNSYVASEIDKSAIKVSEHNFPEIEREGCVKRIDTKRYRDIDLLMGGSPCQGFSLAGKDLNFQDPRSALFFEFVRIKEACKPKYFLLENVKMKKEYERVITAHMGVEPIEINSSLVSGQNRVRLYWTNIPKIAQPEDLGIDFRDLLDEKENASFFSTAIRGRRLNRASIVGRRLDDRGKRKDYDKSVPVTQCLEVRKGNLSKVYCLTTVDKDNVLTPLSPGRYPDAFKSNLPFRYYTVKEYCRFQTLPDDFMAGVSDTKAKKLIGNSWTCKVIEHVLSYIR